VGDLTHDYYLRAPGDHWYKEKGIFYETNKEIQYMRVPHRSLFLAHHYGIPLTQEEYCAILLHDGQYDDANRNYSHKEPNLAMILHFADLWATRLEKENEIVGW
jgi:hypothetical protein